MACTRFICLFAAVAVAAICFAAVEGRAHGRSVSLRQADNSSSNSSNTTLAEDQAAVAKAVADNWEALVNATNLNIKNSQDSWNAFTSNISDLPNIARNQFQTSIDISKNLTDTLNKNTATFFKKSYDSVTKGIQQFFSLFG